MLADPDDLAGTPTALSIVSQEACRATWSTACTSHRSSSTHSWTGALARCAFTLEVVAAEKAHDGLPWMFDVLPVLQPLKDRIPVTTPG